MRATLALVTSMLATCGGEPRVEAASPRVQPALALAAHVPVRMRRPASRGRVPLAPRPALETERAPAAKFVQWMFGEPEPPQIAEARALITNLVYNVQGP